MQGGVKSMQHCSVAPDSLGGMQTGSVHAARWWWGGMLAFALSLILFIVLGVSLWRAGDAADALHRMNLVSAERQDEANSLIFLANSGDMLLRADLPVHRTALYNELASFFSPIRDKGSAASSRAIQEALDLLSRRVGGDVGLAEASIPWRDMRARLLFLAEALRTPFNPDGKLYTAQCGIGLHGYLWLWFGTALLSMLAAGALLRSRHLCQSSRPVDISSRNRSVASVSATNLAQTKPATKGSVAVSAIKPRGKGQQVVSALNGKRILMVEDSDLSAEVAQRLLSRAGALVVRARTGEEGQLIATSGTFDLILMDLGLPGMDGVETMHRLRADGGITVPCLALTASDVDIVEQRCREAGFTCILNKPLTVEAIERALSGQCVYEQQDTRGRTDARSVSEAGNLPVLNVKAAQLRLELETDEYDMLLGSVTAALPQNIKALRGLLEKRNAVELRDIIHRVRGDCANLGAEQACFAARKAEQALEDTPDWDRITDLVGCLFDALARFADAAHARRVE